MGRQKIIRTGNSLAVTVPADFVKTVGIKAGQVVQVKVEPETGQVTYTFSGSRQLPLPSALTKRRRAKRRRVKR